MWVNIIIRENVPVVVVVVVSYLDYNIKYSKNTHTDIQNVCAIT